MLLIALVLILALLPLVMTTAFPHLLLVSVYSSLVFLAALAWAVLVLFVFARKQHIKEWREKRKAKSLAKKLVKSHNKNDKIPLN